MQDLGKKIGEIIHYYSKIKVGIIKLEDDLSLEDRIQIKGHTTGFEQEVDDMQYDHEEIEVGKKGQEVGIKVEEKVRNGDKVYLI